MKLIDGKRDKLIRKLIYRKLFPLPDPARQSAAIDQIKRSIRRLALDLLILNPWTGHRNDSRSTPGNSNEERNPR
jgi:hypothetical protein